jgi:hypothetical protein
MDMSEACVVREIPFGVRDIDAEDAHDPATVSEYAAEIHSHQRAEEVRRRYSSSSGPRSPGDEGGSRWLRLLAAPAAL